MKVTKYRPSFIHMAQLADNQVLHGEVYLRRCESIEYAQHLISRHAERRGTGNFNCEPPVNCDADGSYGVNRIDGNQ